MEVKKQKLLHKSFSFLDAERNEKMAYLWNSQFN